MFNFVFQDYIDDVYKPSRRKLNIIDILLIMALILNAVLLCVFSFLKFEQMYLLISFVSLMVLAEGSKLYIVCRLKLEKKERLTKYKERLFGLESLLKNKKYGNLYNEMAIEWLIGCARTKIDGGSLRKISTAVKNFFQTVIYPILTLTFGVIIGNANSADAVSYALSVVIVIGISAIVIISIQNAYEMFFEHDKVICEYFLSDITYLRTQLPDYQFTIK